MVVSSLVSIVNTIAVVRVYSTLLTNLLRCTPTKMIDIQDFQVRAQHVLTEFAQSIQLSGYPILESDNGVEWKNFNSRTIFTIYHGRLDTANNGKIELAIGIDNIAEELGRNPSSVQDWYQTQLFPRSPRAKKKSPLFWPRIALWSMADVEGFCQELKELYTRVPVPGNTSNTSNTSSSPILNENGSPVVDELLMRQIMTRRGQQDFRQLLLLAYAGCCAISGCPDTEVLEAAHITPHGDTQDYRVSNGLLLRADLHRLFDLSLVSIDPNTGHVVVATHLSALYQAYHGKAMSLPVDTANYPEPSGMMRHYQAWQGIKGEASKGSGSNGTYLSHK